MDDHFKIPLIVRERASKIMYIVSVICFGERH